MGSGKQSMARQKPLKDLSPQYRKRLERAKAKAEREGRPFDRGTARGHSTTAQQTEYQRRKESERRRSEYPPLTPSEIRQIRKFGGTDGDLQAATKLPHAQVVRWLKEQRAHTKDPGYSAPWTMAERVREEEKKYGHVPSVLFRYHSWR